MIRNLLFAALLVLGGVIVALLVQLDVQQDAIERLRGEQARAHEVNSTQLNQLKSCASEKATMVSKIAADTARAEDAVARMVALEYKNEALDHLNRKLRDELAQDDPEVASWFAGSMPASLACSLWEGADSCKD